METPSSTPATTSEQTLALPVLSMIAHLGLVLAFTGLSAGFALALWFCFPADVTSFWDNQLTPTQRGQLFGWMLGGALGWMVPFAAFGIWTRKQGAVFARLRTLSHLASPMACLGFFAFGFRWQLWQHRPLAYCLFVALFALVAYVTVKAAQDAGLARTRTGQSFLLGLTAFSHKWPRLARHLPLGIVVTASALYVAYFSYHTIAFHQGVWTGFDTGIKNNIFWNTLHGAPFKASITMGPDGPSHFGLHADLLVYVLLPFYWLYQKTETILFFQSLFSGAAAVALFWVLIRYVRPAVAVILTLSYLLHPALAGSNIFEFHFTLFGLPLLWATWACVERRKFVTAAVFGVLTLMTREDVSFWIVILGLYFVLSGKQVRAGLVAVVAGMAYFVAIKFIIMPRFNGGQSFTFVYDGLLTSEENTLAGALKTALINPAHLIATLIREDKLIYLLQIFLPLVFLPWRRSIFLLLAIPGFIITILPPHYTAVFNIYFQYSPHWLAFIFPAAAIALASDESVEGARRRLPRLAAIACASLAISYQYGAVLQQNTAWSGPRRFQFGFSDESRRRKESIAGLMAEIPPRAKVAAGSLAAPQFSSRPDAYDMNQGWFDADYVVIPTHVPDFIVNERQSTLERLNDGSWGVVKILPPFALAKKGYSTQLNGDLVNLIR